MPDSDRPETSRVVGAGGTRRWIALAAASLVAVAGLGLAGRTGGTPASGSGPEAVSTPGTSPAVSSIGGGSPSDESPSASSGLASTSSASGKAAASAPAGPRSPSALSGEIFVADPANLAPRATLSVPGSGSVWTDMARIPVDGTATGGLGQVWVTVTSERLLVGEATLPVGSSGRFSGFVDISPPPDHRPAEVRAIEPGPAPELLALVPIMVGTTHHLLVTQAVAVPASRGGAALRVGGLVWTGSPRVALRLETPFGPSHAVTATIAPAVPAATAYLRMWRSFTATVPLPRGMGCGDGSVTVKATWPPGPVRSAASPTAALASTTETATIPICAAR